MVQEYGLSSLSKHFSSVLEEIFRRVFAKCVATFTCADGPRYCAVTPYRRKSFCVLNTVRREYDSGGGKGHFALELANDFDSVR
jgi:hypothetical protein